ncbi:integrator complex subunit 13 [Syngnathoides biaculeatus]|uniref:integrator complex subunit 13 n=1 Tax=Syngnathoides biaculeatus TaxID=300417 RepID=UPI002ADD57F3|nr:integrator complex subunit 13 [Syngnathoides biaculeatus]XP_061662432.1 integrator complex subunit 13 [Syngnathoides biaculeatus]XP_061662433.1 integrator complex subunit 13 [Syngnathoides biaculeatus]XP_061662434.1 integrator complex subunit 13 [Syngnathoides biaculeatus]XP_061662435.1 integrator complex subunit 13 [Syngnathoides biaculeatus]
MKMFSVAHKTVFVVDHCPYMAESSRQQVECDVLTKSRGQGVIPLAPVSKSLWTCAVECSMEYCRILYDIYPLDKLINYIVSDSEFHLLNSWKRDCQSTHELMSSLAAVGPPNPREDPECCSILHGLVAAVESLCKITELQHEKRIALMDTAERVANRGRIICLTNAKSDTHVRMLEDCIQETILEQNKLAAGSDRLMGIQQCELVLIHIYPQGDDTLVSDRPKKEVSPLLTSEVHSVRAGRHLATKLNILVQQHFDLASTTITNIPMKEEQHANTSANYDVELLHHKDAHMEFFKSGDLHMAGSSTRENGLKETVTLKWCTPRTISVELHYCTGAYRISPTDVNSRPSSCLTNFLLNGRSVLLEQPRKSGSKVISHMLSCHGGEIFLHVLNNNRSMLEDPPSISEGCGGRVTDYRITDFGEFMKENRLTPVSEASHHPAAKLPAERAKAQLERHTRYWPMIISQTTIFNMQAVVPLANLIVKEVLTEEDVLTCQKTVYNLVDMERKNDPLPISTVGSRGKGPKRDEQYRIMWNELETLVKTHAGATDRHQRVLECIVACRSKPPEEEERKKRGRKREDREDRAEKNVAKDVEDKSWKDSERVKNVPDKEDQESEVIKDSPDSPEPLIKKPRLATDEVEAPEGAKGPVSLLALWTNRITAKSRKRREFIGRARSVNSKFELYQHLKDENGMDILENGKASR